jgi:PAS domain S-box-containing protein
MEDAILSREALQKSEEKYRRLFESIGEGFSILELIYDDNGKLADLRILEANPAYEKHTGLKRADIVGRLYSELPLATESYWFEIYDRIAKTGIAESFENWHEGTGRWYHAFLSRIGGFDNKLLAIVFNDITDRKQQEQRREFFLTLNDALRPMGDHVSIRNEAMRLLRRYLGSALVAYSEVSEDEEVVTSVAEDRDADVTSMLGVKFRWTDLEPGGAGRFRRRKTISRNDIQNDPDLPAEHKAAFASRAIGSYIVTALVKAEKLVACLAAYNSKAHTWTDDEMHVLEEVSERVWVIIEKAKAEEALRTNGEKLRELNARLMETDKAKTAFFNNVSHEFRTPLTLLIGPIEELIKSGGSKLTSEDMQKLQFAFRSATRLQKLVTTLLDFARIESGKLEAYYQPSDFSKVTADLAGNFRSAMEKAGLKYVVKTEQITEPIYLNREMWEKIVFNLLSNAFKFTHKGKIEVIIREKKKNAELHIKDTGIGIAAKDIERIFERFTRIEGANARTHEGTGIGLALVRELVMAHGGVIKVKSTPGAGTEFIVSIPKGKAHLAKHQIFENRERQAGKDLKESFSEEMLGWLPDDVKASRRNLKRFQKEGASRILIVEDNADMREYLTTVLSEDDHSIYAMEDGQKVVTFLEQGGQADLILADVMMPVLDGFEMIKKLKADPKFASIPVIFLTAKAAEDSKIEGLRMGAEAYLTKPFSSKELRAVVMSTVERVSKNKQNGAG